ncbi:MAG: AAA family ATPase, partial [bacterium]
MEENIVYNREIIREIIPYLDSREAIIILGSRQVGKTTLMRLIMDNINAPQRCFYLDLEETKNLEIVENGVDNLIEYLSSLGAVFHKRNYVFLDEIHYMKNPTKFIKLAVDHYSDKLKIITTGSSALGIKIKF